MSEYHSTIYDDAFEPAAWEMEPRFLNIARLYLGDNKRLGAFKWEYEKRIGEVRYADSASGEFGEMDVQRYVAVFLMEINSLLALAGCDVSDGSAANTALVPLQCALHREAQRRYNELVKAGKAK